MDIWFERRNNSIVRAGTKRGKHFFLFPEVLKTEKNLFPGKQKISPREKKTSVGSEEQRRWNSCAFSSFFFQTSLLLSVNLEIELGLTSSGSASELSSTPHLRLDELRRIFRQRTKTRANVNYLCESLLPSQFMVSAKSDVLSLWNIIAVCCACLLASALELEHCQKFPPAQIALASFFCNLRFCSLKEKLPKRRKTRLSVRRKLLPAHLQIFFSGFSQ